MEFKVVCLSAVIKATNTGATYTRAGHTARRTDPVQEPGTKGQSPQRGADYRVFVVTRLRGLSLEETETGERQRR